MSCPPAGRPVRGRISRRCARRNRSARVMAIRRSRLGGVVGAVVGPDFSATSILLRGLFDPARQCSQVLLGLVAFEMRGEAFEEFGFLHDPGSFSKCHCAAAPVRHIHWRIRSWAADIVFPMRVSSDGFMRGSWKLAVVPTDPRLAGPGATTAIVPQPPGGYENHEGGASPWRGSDASLTGAKKLL